MCLKKYIVFTFSNRDAFERAKACLADTQYSKKEISGVIYTIHSIGKSLERKGLSFSELENSHRVNSGWLDTSEVRFHSWITFQNACNMVEGKDVFGKITVEMQ